MSVAERDRLVPRTPRRGEQLGVLARRIRDRVRGVAVHPHHVVVRLAVLLVALVRSDGSRDLGRPPVRASGHQRGDRRRRAATRVGVVRHAVAHQERAEVRVAEAELAERVRVLRDPVRRVARGADDDLLREEHDVDRVLVGLDVEAAVRAAELHQVQRRQVAGRVVDVHVLRARVRRVDAPAVRARVPLVDRRVVLDARVGAAPRGLGDLVHQRARVERLDRLSRRARDQAATRRPPRRRA